MRITKHRSLGLVVVLAMTVSALLPAGAAAKTQLPNYRPIEAPESVRTETLPASALHTKSGSKATADAGSKPDYEPVTGTPVTGILYDDTAGYFLDDYTIVGVGAHIEVWVQDDMSFPAGDPRGTPVITQAQVDYLVDQFDNNIYPKESEFWRTPATRVGHDTIFGPDFWAPTDGQDRVIAMISNIRDENYYDSSFPVYIAGFFSPTISGWLDRNLISIDAYDWGNRVGPQGSPWRPADGTANDRPFLYEGTFAHEYQHLLHADQNPGEENWVNEGLSDWTEWLVGYGIPGGHWDTAQAYAENSLVIWGDQGQSTEILADYGEAFMFMHYLYGKYGEAGMQALFQDPLFGIAGFNDALASIGADDSFADMYHDFAIARLVLANKGDYRLADIPSPVILNEEAYSTPGAPPWGSDYLKVGNPKNVKTIMFDGVDQLTKDTAWTSVADPLGVNGDVLWSGTGDEVDRFAIFETTGGGMLTFDTLYDIEEQWDFGLVQVSTDNGATWTALANADTRNDIVPGGYPAIMDQLGQGFTGDSGGWVVESFDLSAYSGDILVGFRFMSDWGSNGNGTLADPNWYVDNVAVDGSPVSDGSNASDFKDVSFYQPTKTDFHVDLVSLPREGSIGSSSFKVLHLITDDATEMASASQLRRAMRNSNLLVLVVTYDAPQGVADYAPYEVSIQY